MQLQDIIEFLRKTESYIIKYKILKVSRSSQKVSSPCFINSANPSLELNISQWFICILITGNIRVYCRVRPFLGRQSNVTNVVDCIEEGTITVNTPPKYGKGRRSFNFNKVFGPSATQGWCFFSFIKFKLLIYILISYLYSCEC